MGALARLGTMMLVWAGAAGAADAPPAALDLRTEAGPSQQVIFTERVFPPGGTSGMHVHAGIEMMYLVSGEVELRIPGRPVRIQHPGDSARIERGVPHKATAIGPEPAHVILTFVVDKGSPLRTPVPDPEPAGH